MQVTHFFSFFLIFVLIRIAIMKKLLIFLTLGISALTVSAQPRIAPKMPDYKFTTVKANPITPVKNQYRSGTCWAYSAIGFFESEAIRLGKITDTLKYPDFSEFYVVSNSYYERIRLSCSF